MSSHSKPLLVVTRPTPLAALPPEVAERVNRDFVLRLAETPECFTSDGLVELSDGASGFLVTPFDRIEASFFDRVAASVKIVPTRSVGYDHIDIAAAARRHIPIAYTPGVLTDAVADTTILLLLGASRHAYGAQQFLRAGEWAYAAPLALIGRQLTGKAS
jgi:lactate dehydrogenase-like 2-hydroxyacid dehydrogenase